MTEYRRAEPKQDGNLPQGDVVPWQDGYVFQCPCGERTVYVAEPPHKAEFDKAGILVSLGGSCGYRPHGDRPANWCHFTITDGAASMHGDAECPGARALKVTR